VEDIFENARRLISDARFLQEAGRIRSAGSLAAIGIEQLGAFIEAVAVENNPDAIIRLGLFGDRPNAHARRQDTLASQISAYLYSKIALQRLVEHWMKDANDVTPKAFMDWLEGPLPKPDMQFLPGETDFVDKVHHLIGSGRLKEIREHGFYNDATLQGILDNEISELVSTAEELHSLVSKGASLFPFAVVRGKTS
jgi:hypothetical protein